MKEILEGVYITLKNLGFKVFLGIAPVDTSLPFVNFNIIDNSNTLKDTSSSTISNVTIRVDFWYFKQTDLAIDFDRTKDCFIKNNILLDLNECSLNTTLSGESLELDPDLFENGKEVWRGIMDLNFTLYRK